MGQAFFLCHCGFLGFNSVGFLESFNKDLFYHLCIMAMHEIHLLALSTLFFSIIGPYKTQKCVSIVFCLSTWSPAVLLPGGIKKLDKALFPYYLI